MFETVVELRKFICGLTGPKGLMPPDWVTVRRWKEKVKESGNEEKRVRQLLELHYGLDFRSMDRLIPLVEIVKKTGMNIYRVKQVAKDIIEKVGGRYYVPVKKIGVIDRCLKSKNGWKKS